MAKPLNLLIVEDNPADAELMLHALRRAEFDPTATRVETEKDYREHLNQAPEIVLSDFSMPEFDAIQALSIMQERKQDIPIIIVSGSIGEDRAVQIMQRGATDYIVKDRMGRLGQAVDQALAQKKLRETKKKADRALFESEELARNAFDCTHIGLVVTTLDYRFLRVNKAFIEMMGYSKPDILKLSMIDVTHPEDHAESDSRMKAVLSGEVPYFQLEKRYIHKEGHILWGLANISCLNDVDGNRAHYVCQVQDITERRQLAEQLRQAQKMEAIGLLAGGISHDFNNLLTVINGRSELIIMRNKVDEKTRSELELIHKTGERAAALTRQLLAFSRQQLLEPKVINLNTVAGETEAMLRRLIPENISLKTILDSSVPPILADPSQIEQVIVNLVVNARDAMPKGGKLTLETCHAELSETYCRTRGDVKPGHYVMLTVSDSGTGMPPAVAARIFEPFYTTKEVGKGTGLGLSTVYGIVKQSNGHIAVYSEVGKGTVFKIYLPYAPNNAAPTVSHPTLNAVTTGTETILLVEDDVGVRGLTQDILEMNGYSVHTAINGRIALEFFKKLNSKIDLVITDVVMPEMNGPELVLSLRILRPELKVLFTSGYPDRALVHNGTLSAEFSFIQKPFTAAHFGNKVREILDAPKSPAVQSVAVSSR